MVTSRLRSSVFADPIDVCTGKELLWLHRDKDQAFLDSVNT